MILCYHIYDIERMMRIIYWIILGLVVLILFIILFIIGTYNRLIQLRNLVSDQWSQIDVQLKEELI